MASCAVSASVQQAKMIANNVLFILSVLLNFRYKDKILF
jgi:hypothetical protein